MPIYEYQCGACKESIEKLQKINDPALKVCPKCGQPALSKMISKAGFRLKGQGWYETDFKQPKASHDGGSSAASEKSTSTDSSSSTKE